MKLAVITARGGSKRIPRKNVRPFCGKPILAYSIEAALQSGCFDEVMVSTDDDEIAALAEKYGARVPFRRSPATSNDYATTADVLLEVLSAYREHGQSPRLLCCLYPTAPFITPQVLRAGLDRMESDSTLDTLFPVVRFSFPIQRALRMREGGQMQFFQPEHRLTRSQDLEPAYHDAGQFYWLRAASLIQTGALLGHHTAGIEIPEWSAQDIDNEADWVLAELKYRKQQEAGVPL
ncbi:pseudaminic acid cytidylyltransferase [bacterium]|nr:pseudaminic acid cytidylyltransferase [bacterium]